MSSERLDRREALLGMLAWSSAGTMWLLGAPAQAASRASAAEDRGRWRIVPGERVGDVVLGMSEREVVRLLGEPERRQAHAGVDLELVRRILTDGGIAEEDLPTEVPKPCVFLVYPALGIDVKLHDRSTAHIFAHTGVLSGYESEDDLCQAFSGGLQHDALNLMSNLDDVLQALGPPQKRVDNEFATIPDAHLNYASGISFTFRQDTKALSHICISRRSRVG